jgi:hypothetical protein
MVAVDLQQGLSLTTICQENGLPDSGVSATPTVPAGGLNKRMSRTVWNFGGGPGVM